MAGLLWGVALLNYIDRQMLSTMKGPIMGDISAHEMSEAGPLSTITIAASSFIGAITGGLLAD